MLCKFTRVDSSTGGGHVLGGQPIRKLWWGPNVTHQVHRMAGVMPDGLCSNQWIHYYGHPMAAVWLDHGGFLRMEPCLHPMLWEVKVGRTTLARNGKYGAKKLTTLWQIDRPKLTIEIDDILKECVAELSQRLAVISNYVSPYHGVHEVLRSNPEATIMLTDILNERFPVEKYTRYL